MLQKYLSIENHTINDKNKNSRTILMMVIIQSSLNMVEYLMAHGADVNIKVLTCVADKLGFIFNLLINQIENIDELITRYSELSTVIADTLKEWDRLIPSALFWEVLDDANYNQKLNSLATEQGIQVARCVTSCDLVSQIVNKYLFIDCEFLFVF